MRYVIGPPPPHPVARLFAGLLAILALIAAFFFGMIVLAVAIGVGLIVWLLIRTRLWWLQRQGRIPRHGRQPGQGGDATGGQVIEGEYKVVSRRKDD